MRLPETLSFWAAELVIFPRDLALSIGPILRRLGPVIGSLHRALHAGDGQVDGFDGLALRGSYERLLMSEWLLADEAPEEFNRRAAMAEHTFLRLARPEAVGARRSVALFDAGPDQIGSPRIVHLAILILLARRASAAGAQFSWGILQDRETPLLDDVTPGSVKRLIAARTAEAVTDASLVRWWERIGIPQAADDIWIVGSKQVAAKAAARKTSCIEVRDMLVPRVRKVSVAVRQRTGAAVEVVLDLPGEADSVRLLRDPFSAGSVSAVQVLPKHARTSTVVFAADGFRLLARARMGGILEYQVPSSPRDAVGGPKLRQIAAQGFALAAGRVGDCLIVVSAQRRGFELHYLLSGTQNGLFQLPSGYSVPRDTGTLAACHVLKAAKNGVDLAFFDGTGTLVRLSEHEGRRQSSVLATNVVAWAPAESGVLWVERPMGGQGVAVSLRGDQRTEFALSGDGGAFFGFGGSLAHPDWGLLAIEDSAHSFSVKHAQGASRIRVPADCQVVGVGLNLRRREAGLLVVDVDRRSLIQVGQSWTRRLPREASKIQHVAMSLAASDVAYTTLAGELVLYSLAQETVLRRYVPAESQVRSDRA